jgi:hypothetical protein
MNSAVTKIGAGNGEVLFFAEVFLGAPQMSLFLFVGPSDNLSVRSLKRPCSFCLGDVLSRWMDWESSFLDFSLKSGGCDCGNEGTSGKKR